MECSVITIARTLGAGGEEVGRLVAAELKFSYVDREIIVQAAEKAGVDPETIERVERSPGLMDRILQSIAAAGFTEAGGFATPLLTTPVPYEAIISRVIHEIAVQGRVVIVAHGAGITLAGMGGVLRVFVTARASTRAARLVTEANLDQKRAAKAARNSERQRREYLRRFYDIHGEQPLHYDLVLNTEALSTSAAAQLVVSAAKEARKSRASPGGDVE